MVSLSSSRLFKSCTHIHCSDLGLHRCESSHSSFLLLVRASSDVASYSCWVGWSRVPPHAHAFSCEFIHPLSICWLESSWRRLGLYTDIIKNNIWWSRSVTVRSSYLLNTRLKDLLLHISSTCQQRLSLASGERPSVVATALPALLGSIQKFRSEDALDPGNEPLV